MRFGPFAISGALLAASVLLADCEVAAKSTPAAPPTPQVEVTPVAFRPLRDWDDFTGRLEAVDSVEVRPRVGGFIDSVRFQEGAHVHKGEVLFQIDPRPFQAEVDRLQAEVERARARARLADDDNARGERLIAQNAVARGEAERLDAEAKSAQADVAAAVASLRTAQLNLSFTRVISPIDGRVSKAAITQGNLVTTADRLTTVVSDTPIYAAFNADEQTYLKYAAAQRGRPAPVYLGLAGEEGFPHKGRLEFLDNAVDVNSGTILGRAIFDNADGRFTPGLFARVRLVSADAQTEALVPERALGTDLGRRFVLVLGPQDRVEYRPVTLGQAVGELRIIRSGLQPGDKVVVSGLQKVKPGDAVKPVAASGAISSAELAALDPSG
jgi:multidrug efflux system membrane fusion protein